MLSHDNVTWSTKICTEQYQWNNETHLSYLPMCHVAPLMIDGYIIPCCGGTAFIADKNALKGTLVNVSHSLSKAQNISSKAKDNFFFDYVSRDHFFKFFTDR